MGIENKGAEDGKALSESELVTLGTLLDARVGRGRGVSH